MAARILKVTVSLVLVAAATAALHAQGPSLRPTVIEIRDALMRGGLHEAARVSGGFYRKMEPEPDLLITDLRFVVNASDAVVVGVPSYNRCHMSRDGMSITTDYRLTAGTVLMGDVPRGKEIVVSMPGGRVEFGDGAAAEVMMRGLLPPTAGSRTVMFLEKNKFASDELISWAKGAPIYRVVLGPMGLYTLGSKDSSSMQLNTYKARPTFKHQGESTGKFLQSVKAAIAEAKAEQKEKRKK